jgi:small-conductance mechanosensitive channel
MSFNIFNWLFQDPITAGGPNSDGSEVFHYFWPYLIFCGVGLLIWFYYWVEGRKRTVKHTHYPKEMLDRFLNWLAIICFIGIPIDLAREVLDGYFFAWRFWRYLWLVALLVWAVVWVVYLVRVFPRQWRNEVGVGTQRSYEVESEGSQEEKAKKQKRVRTSKKKDRKKQRAYARR